jgi:hypothetical protein
MGFSKRLLCEPEDDGGPFGLNWADYPPPSNGLCSSCEEYECVCAEVFAMRPVADDWDQPEVLHAHG